MTVDVSLPVCGAFPWGRTRKLCLAMATMRGLLEAKLNLFHTLICKGNRQYEISE